MIKNKSFEKQKSDVCPGVLTLCTAPEGRLLRITRLGCEAKDSCRLCALGLTPGTQVKVLSCGVGLLRVMVRGCNLALDAGLAGLVSCEFVEGSTALPN